MVGIYVNANDVFAWGCADAEPLAAEEIEDLFLLWHENKEWGSTKWLCKKRNKKPQQPIINDMKLTNNWSTLLEELPY